MGGPHQSYPPGQGTPREAGPAYPGETDHRAWTTRSYSPARRRTPRRRGAGGTVVGFLGGVAVVCVLGIVGFAIAAERGAAAGDDSSASERHPGNRKAALHSPLYGSGALSPVTCRLPKIREHDRASMRRFLDTLSDCLDEVWAKQFAKARISGFAAPNRVFWSSPGRSPCGSYPMPDATAFYCPANNTMYVGLGHIVETSGNEPVSNYAVYARVVAHEYGHHVQEYTGILTYGHSRMAASEGAARDEASRRIELQAQCFAGAFLGAERRTLPMTRRQYRALVADVRARGDDGLPSSEHEHGSGKHYAGWMARGYRHRALSACNTWTASPSSVS